MDDIFQKLSKSIISGELNKKETRFKQQIILFYLLYLNFLNIITYFKA